MTFKQPMQLSRSCSLNLHILIMRSKLSNAGRKDAKSLRSKTLLDRQAVNWAVEKFGFQNCQTFGVVLRSLDGQMGLQKIPACLSKSSAAKARFW